MNLIDLSHMMAQMYEEQIAKAINESCGILDAFRGASPQDERRARYLSLLECVCATDDPTPTAT